MIGRARTSETRAGAYTARTHAGDTNEIESVAHEFFGMAAVVAKAKDAQQYAAAGLKASFK